MKINTDLVKSKKFAVPIESSIQKHSQEYGVLATLRYLFPAKFETMIIGETPDLQDTVNGIGIEVAVAVKENDMKASRVFSELCQGETRDIEKYRNKITSCGYSPTMLPNDKVSIGATGTSDGEKYVFQESIRKKMKKIQRYRVNFEKIGLAIILHEIPTSDAQNHFSEWVSEVFEESDNAFDFVYVLSHRFCIYCDVRENVSEKQSLTCEERGLLFTIGRMTAEGELSLTDLEWL